MCPAGQNHQALSKKFGQMIFTNLSKKTYPYIKHFEKYFLCQIHKRFCSIRIFQRFLQKSPKQILFDICTHGIL